MGLLASLLVLASQARRLYFFGDDWAFLLKRTVSWHDLMAPHNEHWSALPVLVFRAMFRLFGIDHYLAYGLLPVLLHVAACVLLFALMRRNGIGGWSALVGTAPLVFLQGNLAENPLWDFQIGFLGSAVLGLVGLLLVHDPGRRSLVLSWAASVLGLMCSGMSLPMVGWLTGYALLRHGPRRACAVAIVPAVVYVAWFLAYGRGANAAGPSATGPAFLGFVSSGLANFWQQALPIASAGGPFLLLLACYAVLGPLTTDRRALAVSGVVAVIAMYALIGFSRAGYGVDFALASRYSYFAALFTLPAFAVVVEHAGRLMHERPGHRAVATAALLALTVAIGITQTLSYGASREKLTDGLEQRLAATERLIDDGGTFLSQSVSPTYNPDITLDGLRRDDVRSALPASAVTRREVMEASVVVQTAASPSRFDLPTADVTLRRVVGDPPSAGCADLVAEDDAWFLIPASREGGQIAVVTSASGLSAALVAAEVRPAQTTLPTTPGVATWIASTARVAGLKVQVPAGPFQLCTSV
ncbi:hypothetical protein [Nocardioides flavescens]|uniref:Glycosyltransferase RgtA/B/C/D-like domain-containing protein n=1 Tax=Nocardioides flavescens TaxID=2691959 RepID=A0A6L7F0V6_9ACTN|nr:hypothetical protein [Nocardioides flavescens]MXG89802.1 hypothetical protein [Nocardioides flavescens]